MHTLEVTNLARYQEPIRLEGQRRAPRVAVRPYTGPREAFFFFNALVARLAYSPAIEELRTDYVEGDAFLPDVVLTLDHRIDYRSSSSNFLINFPGALLLTPGWHGYVYEAEIETSAQIHDATGALVSEEVTAQTYELRHADLDRTIFTGLLVFVGGIYDSLVFDEDLIGSFQAQVSENYSVYAGNRLLDQIIAMQPSEQRTTGTCFAIDRQGTVLTAHHVVKGAEAIRVLLPSGEWHLAQLAQALEAEDLAVLRLGRVTRGFLPVTPAGTASAGLPVLAFAHPGRVAAGVQPEIEQGEIRALSGSGPSRRLDLTEPLDARYAGSPLVNDAGQVVGVVVSPASAGQPARGVPIDVARSALDSLSESRGSEEREQGLRRARSALCFVEARR